MGVIRNRYEAFGAGRSGLLAGTATFALLGPSLACAQPAPGAQPMGGRVSVGAASISHTSSTTTVTQTTQRAAVNWGSFDVGSQQTVTFAQPSSSSITLNRVTSGIPSEIAGRIDANGQIAIVNQSGVVFHQGAEVNAAAVMVSAPGISDRNFMAGRMVFDQPAKPDARVENRGTITVKQAGLAALVAPQVANSGVINAKLGHVVLAGANTATLDLYGDGLLSLDVTNQVKQTPLDANGNAATALVTNSGVIVADGGTVQLTARAADGIVQNLVQAGGKVRAATIGDKTGVVALNGVGGSIIVEGQLSAPGLAPGTKGGAIEVVTSGNVGVASTARVNASGKAGGGTVAVGTTLDRARGGPGVTAQQTAMNVTVQNGATIEADASARDNVSKGDGGRVAVLSAGTTRMDGLITAKGGTAGGNGGFVEVSGENLSMAAGVIDTSAPLGLSGTILLDPRDLDIVDEGANDNQVAPPHPGSPGVPLGDQNTDAKVSAFALTALSGNLVIEASRNLRVDSQLVFTKQTAGSSVSLLAGNNLTVNQFLGNNVTGAISTAGGDLILGAATPGFANFVPSGALSIPAPLGSPSTGTITLNAGTGGITSTGGITTGNNLVVVSKADLTLAGNISARNLFLEAARAGSTLTLGTGAGEFALNAPAKLTASGTGGRISLVADNYVVGVAGSTITTTAGTVELAPFSAIDTSIASGAGLHVGPLLQPPILNTGGGTLEIGGFTNVPVGGTSPVASTSSITIDNAAAQIPASVLRLDAAGPITQIAGNPLTIPGPGGRLVMTTTTGDITLAANVSAANVDLVSAGAIRQTAGALIAGTVTGSAATSASLTQPVNQVAQFGPFATTGDLALSTALNFTVVGAISARNIGLEVAAPGGLLTLRQGLNIPDGAAPLAPGTLTVPAGNRISISADLVSFATGGDGALAPRIVAPAGVVEIAPFTSGRPIDLGSPAAAEIGAAGHLVIGPGDLATIAPATETLRIGQVTGATVPSGGPINVLGPLSLGSTATILQLDSLGAITQGNGDILAVNTLSGQAGSLLLDQSNAIATIGAFSTTGAFSLTNATGLTVSGPLAIGSTAALNVTGALTLAGPVTVPGSLQLIATDSIERTGGILAAGTLSGSAGTDADFGSVAVSSLGAFTTGGRLSLGTTGDLAVAGPVTVNTGLLGAGGNMNITGPVTASSLDLTAGGSIAAISALTVGTLTGSAGGDARFPVPGSIGTLGAFSTTSGFALVDNQPLLVAGPVKDTGAASTLAITTTTGGITLGGDVSGANVNLVSADAVSQPGGTLVAGTLTGRAATSASLTQPTNLIGALGAFSTTSGFALVNNQALTVAGPVTDTGPASTLAMTTTTGGITLAGNVSGANVDLVSAGAISQPGGTLTAGTLTGTSATSASLTQPTNLVGTLGAFSSASGFALVDNQALFVAGPVQDTGAASTLAMTTTTGGITLAGNVSGANVDLVSAGAISQPGGTLIAGTLNGSAASDADFANVSVSTLGAFSVPNGTLTLIDDPPLTIAGPLTVRTLDIVAAGSLVLAGNITGLGTGESRLQVVPDPEGGNISFAQTGAVTLAGAAGSAPVVRIVLPDGTMTFARLAANGVALILDAGTASVSGTMAVGGLTVVGEGGSAALRGSVAGDTTGNAATIARITPGPDQAYTFNGCEIGVAVCATPVVLPGVTASFGPLIDDQLLLTGLPPLLELRPATPILLPFPAPPPPPRVVDRGSRAPGGRLTGHDHLAPPRKLTDPDVVPPNISERDY